MKMPPIDSSRHRSEWFDFHRNGWSHCFTPSFVSALFWAIKSICFFPSLSLLLSFIFSFLRELNFFPFIRFCAAANLSIHSMMISINWRSWPNRANPIETTHKRWTNNGNSRNCFSTHSSTDESNQMWPIWFAVSIDEIAKAVCWVWPTETMRKNEKKLEKKHQQIENSFKMQSHYNALLEQRVLLVLNQRLMDS